MSIFRALTRWSALFGLVGLSSTPQLVAQSFLLPSYSLQLAAALESPLNPMPLGPSGPIFLPRLGKSTEHFSIPAHTPTRTPDATGSRRPTPTPIGRRPYASCVVQEQRDVYDDGQIESYSYLTYDVRGAILTEDRDEDADGQLDLRLTWEYDQFDGKLTEEQAIRHGRPYRIVRYTYNDLGWPIRIDTDGLNGYPSDGRSDQVQTRDYDQFGDDIRISFDLDADGDVDEFATRVFDPPGELVLIRIDHDADGRYDQEISIEWQDGRMVRRQRDDQIDGVIEYLQEYEYDGEGRLSRYVAYSGPNLIHREAILYTHDSRGLLTSEDHFMEDVWHDRLVYEYDSGNRTSRIRRTSSAYAAYTLSYTNTCSLTNAKIALVDSWMARADPLALFGGFTREFDCRFLQSAASRSIPEVGVTRVCPESRRQAR